MANKFRIYLAGPISGNAYENVMRYFTGMTDYLQELGFDVIHPMLGKDALRTEIKLKAHGYGNPESTNHAIVERDQWMVSQADIILCNLLEATIVSIGSVMELAWAHHLGKHTIVMMGKDNIHRHAFILEAADIVFENQSDALKYLERIADA
jgi:nucleoside 2-deoxyribosyltransferase